MVTTAAMSLVLPNNASPRGLLGIGSSLSQGRRTTSPDADIDAEASVSITPVNQLATTRRKRTGAAASRPKNLQACDRCRNKKVKCEPLGTNERDQCRSCQTSNLMCTFDMPLTASRTKRIRRGLSLAHSPTLRSDDSNDDGNVTDTRQAVRQPDNANNGPVSPSRYRGWTAGSTSSSSRPMSIRREGPSSIHYILHSMPTIPLAAVSSFDEKHNLAISPDPTSQGDGTILAAFDSAAADAGPPLPIPDALRSDSWHEVISRLVETFFSKIAPLLPIVERDEGDEAGDLLRLAMAGVAASRRNCPKEIFETIRQLLKQEMIDNDVASDPTRQNVQILLTTCLIEDLRFTGGLAAPASVIRTRLSAATAMAQELCMDRASPSSALGKADQRIWRCAIILDKWCAASQGQRSIIRDNPECHGEGFLDQLLSLSLLLARIQDTIYGPSGVRLLGNDELYALRDDLEAWSKRVPNNLKFAGSWSSHQAGVLHMLFAAAQTLFYRPFMQFSFIVPQAITLKVDLEVWAKICGASRETLEWASKQDEPSDLGPFGIYSLTLSALMQCHAWARRRDWDGVLSIDKTKKTVDQWLSVIPPGHLPALRSQLDALVLLHDVVHQPSALTSFDASARGLNPTPGALNRLPETAIAGVTFIRDASHPRGGVLVATQQAAREIKDLPPGVIVLGGTPADGAEQTNNPGALSTLVQQDTGVPELAFSQAFPFSTTFASDGVSLSMPDWEAAVASFSQTDFATLTRGPL